MPTASVAVTTLCAVLLVSGCGHHGAQPPASSLDESVARLKMGNTSAQVDHILGPPSRQEGNCWIYEWPTIRSGRDMLSSSIDGARLCFVHGRVARFKISHHL
jgi:hypothetical protein